MQTTTARILRLVLMPPTDPDDGGPSPSGGAALPRPSYPGACDHSGQRLAPTHGPPRRKVARYDQCVL